MPTTEPLGATASSRSVSRLRQGKHDAPAAADNSSTPSLASRTSSLGDDSADMRSSMDTAIDKVRERTRKSVDERRGSDDSASNKRLSALLGRGTRKLKRKEKHENSTRGNTLGVHSGDSGELAFSDGRSEGSLLDEDGNSSLLTDDGSDNDGKPSRPTLSPHQSHAAFLTLSSPQLQAQAQPAQRQSAPDISEAVAGESTTSLPTNNSTSSLPQIVEPLDNTSPTAKGAAKRSRIRNASPSPANKLRAGFARNRRKSGESARSGEAGESGVLGGIGGLFKPRSRRNSIASSDPVTEVSQGSSNIQANPADSVSAVQPSAEIVAAPETPPPAAIKANEEQKETPKDTPLRGRINTTSSLPETPQSRPETPSTLVTPPTPTDPSSSTFPRFSSPGARQSPAKPLSSVDSIRHRRAQSQTIPSKLSNAIPAPLTPTIEETKTPGGTLTQPTTATGFFSSVFNVAQKAADQLSATVNTGQKNKGAPAALKTTEAVAATRGSIDDAGEDTPTQSAFETFGKRDRATTADQRDTSSMSSTTDLLRQQEGATGVSHTNKMEEDAAARAVSVAYEKPIAATVGQAMGARPLSIASQEHLSLTGEQSPPPRSGTDPDGIKRSSSVRSKISGRRRRHRENSNATTNTNATAVNSIAAALKDSASGFSSAANTGPGHRLTGFAVASSKRNKDFHQLFRSVPEDDYLIEDYSAALQKEILLHGRLYVSEGHICFSSNIFGWVTNLVISFDEVISVEKKNTAVVFPNALVIQTPHARNTFASFVARDSTYELLIGIWKINHPKLKSSLNGVVLDNVTESDKTEKAGSIASEDDSDEGSEDEVYDEDEDDDDFGSYTEPDAGRSIAGSDVGEPILSRKTSAQPLTGAAQLSGNVSRTLDPTEAAAAGTTPVGNFPGPQTHAPTECTDTAEHYDRPLTDTTIPAPLGKVYSLMFGAESGAFMKKWLVDEQKSRELDYNDDKTGLDNDHKSFTFSYIKPLNAPVGPKQTKCITTNTLEAFDLEKAVTINCSTQTPDVPSGSIFTTKTKYCLMWGPGNSTRMIANCTIEWTGKSWLRGPIEGGAQGGQTQYVKDITAALTAAVSTKAAGKGGAVARKGKKKGKKEASESRADSEQRVTAVAAKEPNWGLFEPLRGPLDPFVSLLRPFFTSQVIIAVLFTLLMYSWFIPGRSRSARSGVGFTGPPERMAAYEELWRREESELWDWLEDRIGMESMYAPKMEGRQKVLAAREMGRRLESEGMKGREVDDAIRVTEERLGALKGAVEREKERKGEKN